MKWEYAKVDMNKQYDKHVQQLEANGWELHSVRAGNDGSTYAIFRRAK